MTFLKKIAFFFLHPFFIARDLFLLTINISFQKRLYTFFKKSFSSLKKKPKKSKPLRGNNNDWNIPVEKQKQLKKRIAFERNFWLLLLVLSIFLIILKLVNDLSSYLGLYAVNLFIISCLIILRNNWLLSNLEKQKIVPFSNWFCSFFSQN